MLRAFSLTCFVAASAQMALAAPLDRHFGGADSCYQRSYSREHLIKHPGQRVTDIRLVHAPYQQQMLGLGGTYHSYPQTPVISLVLSVRIKGQDTWQAATYCTQEGNRLRCALECDAGSFFVRDRTPNSILIEGGGDIYFSDCGEGPEQVLRRAPDDKVFLLHRLPNSQCRP